jgi:hypothetical protein
LGTLNVLFCSATATLSTDNVEYEALANMFSAAMSNKEAYNLIVKYFPDAVSVFEEIVMALV